MSRKVAYFGILLCLALILSYVEALVPLPLGIPGVKLGLPNLLIVVALYTLPLPQVYLLSTARILVSGFLFGGFFGIVYSLAGGLLSLTVMAVARHKKFFSVFGVSMAGGVSHNLGQLLVAAFVVQTASLLYYLPVLLVSGLLTGALIGVVAGEVGKRVPQIRRDWK